MRSERKFLNILTKEYLYTEYVEKKKTTTEIAEASGCSHAAVNSYLRFHNIPLRRSGRRPSSGNGHPCWKGTEHISGSFWYMLVVGAYHRHIPVELTIEEAEELLIKQDFKCALTGWPLVFANSAKAYRHAGTTASLDRIDSTRSYSYDNVQWVHKDINRMKSIFSNDYFVQACLAVADNLRGLPTSQMLTPSPVLMGKRLSSNESLDEK